MQSQPFIFWISLIGSIAYLVFLYPTELGLCQDLEYSCREVYSNVATVFLLFPPILFFSAALKYLNRNVYEKWWNFAKFCIPVAFVIICSVSFQVHHLEHGQWQDLFDELIIISIFSIFIIGSLIQIARGYWAFSKN